MKKILKTAAVALAGILAIGLAACTDGDGGFVDEVPSYYNDRGVVVDETVTAVWDFSDSKYFAADSNTSDHVFAESIEIKPSSGTGATLYPTYIKGRYEDKKTVRTAKVNNKSLSDYNGVYY
ncbi:MAG: hypothetical protein HDR39_02160, partial [Treponema sp.]|nr:hypothetical protein [Treponema sp.]